MYFFELYKDFRGEYRWRFKAPNGKIIADSAEGYTSSQGAIDGLNLVAANSSGAPIRRFNF